MDIVKTENCEKLKNGLQARAFFGDIYKQVQKLDSEASLKGSKRFKRGMTRPSFVCESAPS